MFKPMIAFAEANGLTCEKKPGIIYGSYQGYYISIAQDPQVQAKHTITLCIKEGSYQPAKPILTFLNDCAVKYKFLRSVSYNNFRATIEFQGSGFKWGKTYVPMMEEFLQELVGYCKANMLVNCCEHCGSEDGVSAYLVGGKYHALCPQCQAQVKDSIAATAHEMKAKRGNLVTGIVGALLGSLIGVIAWILVYQLGYIAAIVGLVMIVCTFKGFSLFGGKLNALGIGICVLISVGMLYVAERLSLSLELYNAAKTYYNITFFDAYRSLSAFLAEADLKGEFLQDLVYGYVFMAVGGFSTVWHTYKQHNVAPGARELAAITAPAAGMSTSAAAIGSESAESAEPQGESIQ